MGQALREGGDELASSSPQDILVPSRCTARDSGICNITLLIAKRFACIRRPSTRRRATQDTPFSVNYSIRGEFVVLEGAFEQWCQSRYFFILTTNDLDEETFSKKEVLNTYKSQQSVERGFRFLKSPEFFTSAFFVKKPERIEALLMIMTLSLLVYGAIEYKIRQELQGQRVDFVDQRKKPTRKSTSRNAFWGFLLFPWVSCGVHPGITESSTALRGGRSSSTS